jgi:hypothetical protein
MSKYCAPPFTWLDMPLFNLYLLPGISNLHESGTLVDRILHVINGLLRQTHLSEHQKKASKEHKKKLTASTNRDNDVRL